MIRKTALILMLMSGLSEARGEEQILWWSVSNIAHLDETQQVKIDDTGIVSFLSNYSENYSREWSSDDNWFGARVSMFGTGLESPVILPIYCPEYTYEGVSYPAEWVDGDLGVELSDDLGGHWGAIYNASKMPNEAVLETLIQMEIGVGSWDETAGDWAWETIAYSDAFTKEQLSGESYFSGSLAPPNESWGG